jgi:hypothetical protein
MGVSKKAKKYLGMDNYRKEQKSIDKNKTI